VSGQLTINGIFTPAGQTLPTAGTQTTSQPANAVGGGNLQTVFEAAADWWEYYFQSVTPQTVTIRYGWAPANPGALASATWFNAASFPGGDIRFDSDGDSFFLDPTPLSSEEWTNSQVNLSSYGSRDVFDANYLSGYSGPSAPNGSTPFDAFSIALHEIGHLLGAGSTHTWDSDVSDGDIDTSIGAFPASGGHLALPTPAEAVLNSSVFSGIRTFLTEPDTASIADANNESIATNLSWSITGTGTRPFDDVQTWETRLVPDPARRIWKWDPGLTSLTSLGSRGLGGLGVFEGTLELQFDGTLTIHDNGNLNTSVAVSGGWDSSTGPGNLIIAEGRLETPEIEIDGLGDTGSVPTMTIEPLGMLDVDGDMYVGDTGAGHLQMNGGSVAASSIHIGSHATGTGRLEQSNGSITTTGSFLVGLGGTGTLNIHQGTIDFDGSGIVGTQPGSTGVVNQSGGTVSAAGGGHLVIGRDAGAVGTYNISGGLLQTLNGRQFTIGNHGHGMVSQTGGQVQVDGSMYVGGNTGGEGNYSITSAAALEVNGLYLGYNATSRGIFNQVGGDVTVNGVFSLGNASLQDNWFDMDGGTLSLNGEESYFVGRSGQGTFIQRGGTVTVNDGSLYVGDQETGDGEMRLSGGSLNITDSNRGLHVGARGDGKLRITGASALVTVPSLTLGLEDEGMGEVLHTAGVLNIEGSLEVGALGQGNYEMSGGELTVGGHMFVGSSGTFAQSGGKVAVDHDMFTSGDEFRLLGGELDVSRGRIEAGFDPDSFKIAGGTLHVGEISGDLRNEGGTLAPGAGTLSFDSPIGFTKILGSYTQEAGGSLDIEIESPSLQGDVGNDYVLVTGPANLAGDLELSLIDDFVPSFLDNFLIFEATSLIGAFDNAPAGSRLDVLDGSGSFLVNYGSSSSFDPSQIVLSDFQSISQDPLLRDWEENFGSTGGGSGDFDLDADVDGADFLMWQRDFIPALAASTSQTVPEPSSLFLLSLVAASCFATRRSK